MPDAERPSRRCTCSRRRRASRPTAPPGRRLRSPPPPSPAAQRKLARQQAKEALQKKRELKKKKIEEKKIKAFRDYFDYHEEIRNIPPHRVLAINRGERARVLRVRLDCRSSGHAQRAG